MDKPDKYSYHEMLDRLHIIDTMIEEVLKTHQVYFHEKELKELIDKTSNNISAAYNYAGYLSEKRLKEE